MADPNDDGIVAGPFGCFGQRWSITGASEQLGVLLTELYRPLLLDVSEGGRTSRYILAPTTDGDRTEVYRDAELLGTERRPSRVLGKLMWAINRQVIDRTTDRVLLHASAAALDDGRGVLLPAPMESGKTTLVTGLLDRGLHYLTDEAAAVDPDLSVHGFSKPLSIDMGSWDVLRHHEPQLPPELHPYMERQWQVPPHTFTTVVPSGRLAVVVFPTYCAGEPTSLEPLSAMDALDLARASTFGVEGTPVPAVKLAELATMVTSVPCFALRSGDLGEACDAVLSTLADAPR